MTGDSTGASDDTGSELSRWQKIAVLMVTLGEEAAGELLRQFSDDEVAHITRAIAEIKTIPKKVQDQVLAEFEGELKHGRVETRGGETVARGMLEHALGRERADEVWSRLGQKGTSFEVLERTDPKQVAPYLRREHPQTIALILSQVQPAQAAAILEQLPAQLQPEVAHRIATLEQVSPEVLEGVEAGLAQVLAPSLGGDRTVEGPKVAADILNRVGAHMERNVLDQLDAADPEVAEQIRSRMFVFDDLGRLSEQDMRLVLQNVDMKEMLVALKAAGKGVLDAILKVLSERRQQQILEDLQDMPRMRLSEVEEVQNRIVQQLRQLEEQGLIRLPHGEDEEPFI